MQREEETINIFNDITKHRHKVETTTVVAECRLKGGMRREKSAKRRK